MGDGNATAEDTVTEDTATENMAAVTDRLMADGFALLDRRCEADAVRRMLDVARRRLGEAQEALGTKEIGIGSVAGYAEIVQRSPGRWDVPFAPEDFGVGHKTMPWWPLITAALGEDADIAFSGVVASEPGSPAQYWHSDSPHESHDHGAPHALNVLVALHDIPMDMGPTEVARGSHVLTNHLSNPALVVEELVYQHAGTTPESLVNGTGHDAPEGCSSAMPAGTCLVFDDRILHRGLANDSESTRHVAYFAYFKSGYATETYFESDRSLHDEPT